jgi:hypothetical protein
MTYWSTHAHVESTHAPWPPQSASDEQPLLDLPS